MKQQGSDELIDLGADCIIILALSKEQQKVGGRSGWETEAGVLLIYSLELLEIESFPGLC